MTANRWYDLKYHPQQYALLNDLQRFKVVAAGRRSGKTEIAKRFLISSILKPCSAGRRFFAAAPTHSQAKKIFWQDLKDLSYGNLFVDRIYEGDLIIKYKHGASLYVLGLDAPKRIEGTLWAGGLIDEFADLKPSAWAENIKPALDTVVPTDPDYRAWCWLFGVPEGRNHFYELAEYARTSGDPDWKFYHWLSADILPPDIIASAKRTLSAQQFRQEYEAAFETATGLIYADYNDYNIANETLQAHEAIMWMHDFNYTPLSSAIGVRRGNSLFIVDEIVLISAVARQAALEFVERYKNHQNKRVYLYGDPAGKAGEKHGQQSNYTEIEQVLRSAGWQVERKVRAAAPAIRDRQNAVRAKICNADNVRSLFVNPARCQYAHKGLSNVTLKEGSTFIEQESDVQHITTAIGYCIHYEWPVLNKVEYQNIAPVQLATQWNKRI